MFSIPSHRPRLLENYLRRELLKISGLTMGALLAVFLLVDFFEKIDKLAAAGLGVGQLSLFLLLKIPFALGQILPPTILVAVILTMGLLARSQEIMAIKTAGLDILRLTRPMMVVAVWAGVLLCLGNASLIPWSQARFNSFWETQVSKKPPRSLINLEHFWYKGDQAIYNIMLFRKDLQLLEGVKIFFFDRGFRLTQIVSAKTARWEGDAWCLSQGFIQTFSTSGPGAGKSFQELQLTLTERPEDFQVLEKKIREMDIGEIYSLIGRLERDGYKSTAYRLDMHHRLSQALPPIILALVGLGLALRQEKINLPMTVAVGLTLMFGYWLLTGLCLSMGQADRWPVFWAVWLPHGMMALVAFILLRQSRR